MVTLTAVKSDVFTLGIYDGPSLYPNPGVFGTSPPAANALVTSPITDQAAFTFQNSGSVASTYAFSSSGYCQNIGTGIAGTFAPDGISHSYYNGMVYQYAYQADTSPLTSYNLNMSISKTPLGLTSGVSSGFLNPPNASSVIGLPYDNFQGHAYLVFGTPIAPLNGDNYGALYTIEDSNTITGYIAAGLGQIIIRQAYSVPVSSGIGQAIGCNIAVGNFNYSVSGLHQILWQPTNVGAAFNNFVFDLAFDDANLNAIIPFTQPFTDGLYFYYAVLFNSSFTPDSPYLIRVTPDWSSYAVINLTPVGPQAKALIDGWINSPVTAPTFAYSKADDRVTFAMGPANGYYGFVAPLNDVTFKFPLPGPMPPIKLPMKVFGVNQYFYHRGKDY